MKYRPEIDGLRALAIMPVIFFHAGFSLFSGGFVGVDIFFVISGYLITSIIIADILDSKFSITNFYERRARRILPALFLAIILCIPVAWFFMLPDEFKNFGQSVFANSFFISNFLFWIESGYFAEPSELKPLLHTWSLAVEEQFYVLFPLFLLAVWRYGKNIIFLSLILLLSLSLFFSQYSAIYFPQASFFLLPSRAWEMLLGSIAALIFLFHNEALVSRSKFFVEIISVFGMLLIIASIYFYSEETSFPGFSALLPTIGTFLLILFCNQSTIIGKLLGAKVLVGFGLISYSLYIFHQPIFVFAKIGIGRQLLILEYIFLIILSIFLAFLSWKYVERPFRNRSITSKKFIFSFSLILIFILAVSGFVIHKNNGFSKRFNNFDFNNIKFSMPSISNDWCFYDVNSISSLQVGENGLNCFIGDLNSSKVGLLFGDSFAGHYDPAMDIFGRSSNLKIHSVTTNWCFPTTKDEFGGPKSGRMYEQCKFNRDYLFNNFTKYDFIILSGDWSNLYSQDKIIGITDAIDSIASLSPFVIILPAPKKFDTNILDAYKRSKIFNFEFKSDETKSNDDKVAKEINKILQNYASKYDNVFFVKRASLFGSNGIESDVTNENIPYSLDGGHISIYGSLKAGDNLLTSDQYTLLLEKMNSINNIGFQYD